MSGRFAPIINVAAPSRVRPFSPDSASAAPTSVWQMLSMSGADPQPDAGAGTTGALAAAGASDSPPHRATSSAVLA